MFPLSPLRFGITQAQLKPQAIIQLPNDPKRYTLTEVKTPPGQVAPQRFVHVKLKAPHLDRPQEFTFRFHPDGSPFDNITQGTVLLPQA